MSFYSEKSPMHYVGQYLEAVIFFFTWLTRGTSNSVLLERFSRKSFPLQEWGGKLVTVTNQLVLRYPTTPLYFLNQSNFSFQLRKNCHLAICAWKPKVPGSSPAATYSRSELFAVITQLMSRCL